METEIGPKAKENARRPHAGATCSCLSKMVFADAQHFEKQINYDKCV